MRAESAGQGVRTARRFEHAIAGLLVSASDRQAAAIARNRHVARVEPDRVTRAAGWQLAPPWGLDRVDQRALPLDGTFTPPASGAGVDAYVVDTGVRSTHTDFGGRVTSGHDALGSCTTEDCNGHGTHVAGTVAGERHGVAKQARIIPVRVLGCDGSGTVSGLIAGLDWLVAHHAAGTPAVANLSVGAGASSSLDDAVKRVLADGVTVVVSAGNAGADACTVSPARVPAALTVGATSSADAKPSWSNHGTCLDLFAPGCVGRVGAPRLRHRDGDDERHLDVGSAHRRRGGAAAGRAAVAQPRAGRRHPAQPGERGCADRRGQRLTGPLAVHRAARRLRTGHRARAGDRTGAGHHRAGRAAEVVAGPLRKALDASWTAPADGGSAITSYTVRAHDARATARWSRPSR